MHAIDWVDLPTDTKERTVLTHGQIGVPGVRVFGYDVTTHAKSPLMLHFHRNCFELTYIAKGSICFSSGEHLYNLSGGDLFLTQPNEVHNTGEVPLSLHRMFWIQLDVSDPNGFLYLQEKEAARIITALSAVKNHVVTLDTDTTCKILEGVFGCFYGNDNSRKYEGAALLVLFLYRVLSSAEKTRFSLTPDIGRAVNYVLDHIEDPLSIEQLASISLLSASRFKQKFKEQMGITPRDFVNKQKVKGAQELLAEGKNITETAMELGFSSSSYFSVVFKRFTNDTPLQYTKSIQKKRR